MLLEQKRDEDESDHRIHSALGLAYARLDRADDAVREGEQAVDLCPVSADTMLCPYALLWLAKIYARVGEEEAALDRIEALLAIPSELSPAMLRLDPDWDPLRANPRFKMLAETDS